METSGFSERTESNNFVDSVFKQAKILSVEERNKLEQQNSRLVSEYQARKLELDAKKNWDLFYKRNETRFFKDRHWTTREFEELTSEDKSERGGKVMLEIGCGVGNLIFPLIEDDPKIFIYACDFSPIAIEFVKTHPLYKESRVKAFQCDITENCISNEIPKGVMDIATLVFVLSAIHPKNFNQTLQNIYDSLKPGGILLFRDYGLYDMAQLRFKAGHKISENFYVRQDGTRCFYFSIESLEDLFKSAGFEVVSNAYVHRRTVNKKEDLDVPRIFVQGKFRKPL